MVGSRPAKIYISPLNGETISINKEEIKQMEMEINGRLVKSKTQKKKSQKMTRLYFRRIKYILSLKFLFFQAFTKSTEGATN